jgi:ABC-type glycerol-3-phosphate transport system permease component
MARGINWLGRALGVVCAAVLASAWAFALWVPSAGLTVTGISVVTALLLVAFAVFAGIAAAHGHAVVLVLLFLASFFPVGAFLIPTDHWLKWVGWVDLGLLAAAILLWLTRRRDIASA